MKKTNSGILAEHRITIESCDSQVTVVFNENIIAESRQALVLLQQGHKPVYYFPRRDVRMDLLNGTSKKTFCPFKGDANHWALTSKDRHVEIAAWSYINPLDEVGMIKDYIAFYPEAIDKIIEK